MHYMEGYDTESDEALVQEVYCRYDEDTRLGSKAARVEFLTNTRYIEHYLKPGARILDLGAGTGEYSVYFSRKGYPVTALELSLRNVEVFRHKLKANDSVELIH